MSLRLTQLKTVRQTRDVTPAQLAKLSGLDVSRIRALENVVGQQEPWLDEAYTISRALGLGGTNPLISLSGNLTGLDLGFPLASDVDVWRAGLRLPLSIACRLAVRFGLSDPADLVAATIHRQIWDIVERNERGAEPGCCPWCLADLHAGEPHAITCLPDNLWGRRDLVDPRALGHIPRPSGPGKRRTASGIAKGLKAARARALKTQDQIAHAIGVHPNHYARMERREVPLLLGNAEKLAALLRVTVETLYAEPDES